MLRRTLAVLTPALFALPLLLTPTSQLYADADGMASVYSAMECIVDEDHPTPSNGQALYRTNYGPGRYQDSQSPPADPVPNLKGITNIEPSTGHASNRVIVNCPLPRLDKDDMVVVTIVDGTAQDDVVCRLRACDGGVGIGSAGTTGGCEESRWLASNSSNGNDGYTPVVPPAKPYNYVSTDLDFLTFNYPTAIGTNSISAFVAAVGMLGTSQPKSNLTHPELNPVDFSLVCVIPAQDTNQVTAGPGRAGINTYGYSYIQSYEVNP